MLVPVIEAEVVRFDFSAYVLDLWRSLQVIGLHVWVCNQVSLILAHRFLLLSGWSAADAVVRVQKTELVEGLSFLGIVGFNAGKK
jgi:hypothetical protein